MEISNKNTYLKQWKNNKIHFLIIERQISDNNFMTFKHFVYLNGENAVSLKFI